MSDHSDIREFKRAHDAVDFRERLETAESRKRSLETLKMARALALAGLPKRRIKGQTLSRELRLGRTLWLKADYSVSSGDELPFGADRLVLAALQHYAIQQDSPVVTFERVSEVLELFDLDKGGQNLRLLRERFRRLSNLAIRLRFAETQKELQAGKYSRGENLFVIETVALPTRRDLLSEKAGQGLLAMSSPDEIFTGPYGVRLASEFWTHLRESTNRLIVPLELLKLFRDRPTGWDYCCFLLTRCGSAKTTSAVPHEALISLFRDKSGEADRHVVRRLQRYHKEIMAATGGRLNAEWFEDAPLPSTGGRPKKRWGLKVGPSKSVLGRIQNRR